MGDNLWMIRPDNQDEDVEYSIVYSGEPRLFSLKIHHGGEFILTPKIRYIKGKVSFVDCRHIDNFDRDILDEMVKNLGYPPPPDMVLYFHFKVPDKSLENGLRIIDNDHVCKLMFNFVATGHKLLDIYVEHDQCRIPDYRVVGKAKYLASVDRQKQPVVETDNFEDECDDGFEILEEGKSIFQQIDEYVDGEDDYADDYSTDEELPSSQPVEQKNADDRTSEDEEDEDFVVDDCIVEDVEVDLKEYYEAVVSEEHDQSELNTGAQSDTISEFAPEATDMDLFQSNSDDDEEKTPLKTVMRRIRKKQLCRSNVISPECPWYVGQKIDDKEHLKNSLKQYALISRRQLFLVKNDKTRFRAVCLGQSMDVDESEGQKGNFKKGKTELNDAVGNSSKDKGIKLKTPRKKPPTPTCPWVFLCSRPSELDSWVVKTLKDQHTCLQTRDLRQYTMSFIAKEIIPLIQNNPHMPLHVIQEHLQKVNQINVGIQKIFRAKMIASKKIIGDYHEQYTFLRDYCEEILRTNPGSTVKIEVEPCANPGSETRQFKRIYMCYGALKRGFKMCGRNLIGVDGAFMKGPYPGQILSAVAVDANNGIYPIAIALVEAETYSSWVWFLELLGDDLEFDANSYVTFISDRQKGLIPSMAKVFPHAEHRFCLRHIHENLKKQWGGVFYKNLLWKAASATNQPKFLRVMEEIRQANAKMYEWLSQIPPVHWSRYNFSGRAQCDILLNNLCEVFNKQLVAARDKPVYTCLEYIRTYLQKRIVTVNKVISKSPGPLTPAATKLFNKIKEDASQYTVLMSGNDKYQVNGPWNDQVVMDMESKTCTCRRWDITGMPCRHVVAVIWDMARNNIGSGIAEKYVSKVYWLETWKDTYAFNINPISGRDNWMPSMCPTTLIPPKHHKPIGRPKKSRRKSVDEVQRSFTSDGKITRKGATTRCGKCGKQGHNSKGCRGQGGESSQKAGAGKRKDREQPSVEDLSQNTPHATQEVKWDSGCNLVMLFKTCNGNHQ